MHLTNSQSVSKQEKYKKHIHDQISTHFSMDEMIKQVPPQADLHQWVIRCENCSHQSILLTKERLKGCYCPSCGALV
ncbi:DNA-directed RNA polymerase subunit RPC12/RpoP [Bacillus fengqiuensis]|nr:DNA-directed RNA polymerase subunit RPC12/RpoP [Bacillus fengqiuensis]